MRSYGFTIEDVKTGADPVTNRGLPPIIAAAGPGVAAHALSRHSSDGGDNGQVLGYGTADAAIIPELLRRRVAATAQAEVA